MIDWIDVKKDLPTAEDLEGHGAEKYLVQIEGFQPAVAMFLVASTGECGWYINYVAKIIRHITHWAKIEEL